MTYNNNSISFKAAVWMIQWQVFFSKIDPSIFTFYISVYANSEFQLLAIQLCFSSWWTDLQLWLSEILLAPWRVSNVEKNQSWRRKLWSLCTFCQGEELLSSLWVLSENTQHGAGHSTAVHLLYSTHDHAHVTTTTNIHSRHK